MKSIRKEKRICTQCPNCISTAGWGTGLVKTAPWVCTKKAKDIRNLSEAETCDGFPETITKKCS